MSDPKLSTYVPEKYWEGLLQKHFDLKGVGYPNLSIAFNQCLYRAMQNSMDRGLKRLRHSRQTLSRSSVLDAGCGTGFWIDFWKAKGVKEIVGMDLTHASISHLSKRYPKLNFERRDISKPIDTRWVHAFDIISAMSILHHIPSQDEWRQALLNLGRMLKPGGYLVIMDPILKYRWWGKPFASDSTGRPRTLSEHLTILGETGVTLHSLIPTVVILANPVDTKGKLEFRFLERWWSFLYQVASRERWMRNTSWLFYSLDRLFFRLNYMPTSKIMFCQKSPLTGEMGS